MELVKELFWKFRKRIHKDIHDKIDPEYRYIQTIARYCYNQTLLQAGVERPQIAFYRQIHRLLHLRRITGEEASLCRVGSENDGGYMMIRPFSRKKLAYSFGISGDVSWDEQMAEEGYSIYQYDHTIS